MKVVVAVFATLLLVMTLACGDSADLDLEGANGANVSVTQPTDPHGQPTCNVDFPCRVNEEMRCVGETTYRKTETRSCEYYCGDDPCSGAACEAVGPVLDCPVGQACIRDWTHGHHCAPADSVPGWLRGQQVSEGLVPLQP